jgi:hypothetical protein
VSSEVEKRVGTEPLKAIKGIAVFNQKFQRDASFRSQLQDALLEVGVPGTVKISEANLADDIGDVLNAACAASSVAGAAPVAAGACGLALGYAIGKFLGGL